MASEESTGAAALPLAGVRVLDMTDGGGEMCGRYLADLGADVLRVVPTALGKAPDDVDIGALRAVAHHAGKRVLVSDWATDDGRRRLDELVAGADIWIESTRPGEAPAGGLEPAEAARRHPALVVASITDFGRTGPYAAWQATDAVLTAMTGVLSRSGLPGREPLIPPADIALETAAVQAVWGILVSYHRRLVTGRGDHLDVSLYELAAQVLDPVFGTVGTARPGGAMADIGRGRPESHSYPVLPCANGHVRLSILAPRQWRAMRAWLGEPEALQDPALDSIFERAARLPELAPYYTELFSTRGKTEVATEAQSRGIPIAPILTAGEVLEAEHFRERGTFATAEVAGGLTAQIPHGAIAVDGVRAAPRQPAAGDAPWPARRDDDLPDPGPVEGGPHRPLEGLRVLDLGVIVVGADTARLFADQGAEVIKIESAAYPDMTRIDEMSFVVGHRGSRSIGLNLRSPEGVGLFRRLVAISDVVLANFKPGTLEKLALGPDDLHAINPNLVVVSSSAFGDSGPWSSWMGYGPLVRVATGITSLWRYPDRPDAVCDGMTIYPDHYAARVGAIAGLAGVIGRLLRRGGGSTFTVSQAEATLMHLSAVLALESVRPGTVVATGNAIPGRAPAGLFACGGDDEWCVIEVRDDADWTRLCEALGRPDWTADAELTSVAGRLARRDELERRLAQWTAERTPLEVAEALQASGVPAGPMLRPSDLADNPHLAARRFFNELDQPGLEPIRVENGPVLSTRLPDPEMRPSPYRGEHTREICRDLLDLDDAEIEALMTAGVLEDRAEKITI